MTAGNIEYINAWLQKAGNDIRSAHRLIDIEPMILDSACFHCQQGVEKSLKAFLCYKGCDIEKTHDIDYLLSECSRFDTVFEGIDSLNITDFAVQGRYPDFNLLPEAHEARKLYDFAVHINTL